MSPHGIQIAAIAGASEGTQASWFTAGRSRRMTLPQALSARVTRSTFGTHEGAWTTDDDGSAAAVALFIHRLWTSLFLPQGFSRAGTTFVGSCSGERAAS